eukprot:scaffold113496_cov66-Phaeocystis_antarctica.AAC.3
MCAASERPCPAGERVLKFGLAQFGNAGISFGRDAKASAAAHVARASRAVQHAATSLGGRAGAPGAGAAGALVLAAARPLQHQRHAELRPAVLHGRDALPRARRARLPVRERRGAALRRAGRGLAAGRARGAARRADRAARPGRHPRLRRRPDARQLRCERPQRLDRVRRLLRGGTRHVDEAEVPRARTRRRRVLRHARGHAVVHGLRRAAAPHRGSRVRRRAEPRRARARQLARAASAARRGQGVVRRGGVARRRPAPAAGRRALDGRAVRLQGAHLRPDGGCGARGARPGGGAGQLHELLLLPDARAGRRQGVLG